MRRLLLLPPALLLLAAACGPTIAPPMDYLAAGEVVRAATGTAITVATQSAMATATEESARSTSTAAALATRDTLAMRATEQGLAILAGQATQAAQDTQAARRMAQDATHAAQTPTRAAVATLAAAAAADRTRQQAQAADVAEFWQTLRWVIVAVLAVGGAVGCVLAWIWGRSRIRLEELRTAAAIARDAFRILTPGHWAEYVPGEGYQVYTMPGEIAAPTRIVENVPHNPNLEHHWRHSIRLFCWWGDMHGFGIREIGPAGAGVVTDPDWRTISAMLKAAGVLTVRSVAGPDGRRRNVTTWADSWGFQRLADDLSHGRIALPFPAGAPAPEIMHAVPTQHHAEHTATQPHANTDASFEVATINSQEFS